MVKTNLYTFLIPVERGKYGYTYSWREDFCSKSSEEINGNEEHSEDMLDLLTGLK